MRYMLIYNFIIKSPTYILVHMYFGQKKKKKVGPSAVSQHMKLHYKIFYLLYMSMYVLWAKKGRNKLDLLLFLSMRNYV